jgi:hypothetical protein
MHKAVATILVLLGSGLVLPGQDPKWGVMGQLYLSNGQPAAGVRVAVLAAPDKDGEPPASREAVLASQTDAAGRYTIRALLPGRYYIVAGSADSLTYYPGATTVAGARAVALGWGSTTVDRLDFSLGPVGVRVSGHVAGASNLRPEGSSLPHRVTLTGDRSGSRQRLGPRLDTSIGRDGGFEFPKVIPGRYVVAIEPEYTGVTSQSVEVSDKDISAVVFSIPALVRVQSRVVVEGNGPLPNFVPMNARGPTVSLQLRLASGGAFGVSPALSPDGAFVAILPEGDYRIALGPGLAARYEVQSFTYGGVNLLTGAASVRASNPQELLLRLKINQATVRVAGRVVGVNPSVRPEGTVRLRSVLDQYSIEAKIGPDGSFEFPRVYPGEYRLDPANPALVGFSSVVVGDKAITDLELAVNSRAPSGSNR